jgi:hypothetical protein
MRYVGAADGSSNGGSITAATAMSKKDMWAV